jgi:site-specific recombinase XerD
MTAGKAIGERLVRTRTGATPTRQSVLARTKSLQRRYGIRECSFHSLRHFFCTTLIQRGASMEAVRKLAGHSSLSVLDRYVHASGRDLREAIGLLVRAA